PRNHRHAGALGQSTRGSLRTHLADGFGGGADEDDASRLTGRGEVGILGEEAVTRVDGFDAVAARGVHDMVDIQVAGCGRGWSDVRSFIGYAEMERGAVGIRVDGHGANVHFPEGADD